MIPPTKKHIIKFTFAKAWATKKRAQSKTASVITLCISM